MIETLILNNILKTPVLSKLSMVDHIVEEIYKGLNKTEIYIVYNGIKPAQNSSILGVFREKSRAYQCALDFLTDYIKKYLLSEEEHTPFWKRIYVLNCKTKPSNSWISNVFSIDEIKLMSDHYVYATQNGGFMGNQKPSNDYNQHICYAVMNFENDYFRIRRQINTDHLIKYIDYLLELLWIEKNAINNYEKFTTLKEHLQNYEHILPKLEIEQHDIN